MSEKKYCIIWMMPLCNLSQHIVKRLKDADVEVEERKLDGFNWTWTMFKEASPNWSRLPLVQKQDGTLIKNVDELDAWIGKDPAVHKPEASPLAPR